MKTGGLPELHALTNCVKENCLSVISKDKQPATKMFSGKGALKVKRCRRFGLLDEKCKMRKLR